jgi:phosphate-selective porin OprO/OprP
MANNNKSVSFVKRILFLTLLIICVSASASEQELLDTLLKNGAINKEQHQTLSANKKQYKEKQTKSKNEDINLSIGGTIQVDAAYIKDDKSDLIPGSGTEIRRTRLYVRGDVYTNWGYKLRAGFEEDELSMKDAYLEYKPASFRMGLFKPGFSIDELTSSKYITFMERALPNAFKPGRRIGLGYHNHSKIMSINTNLFGQGSNEGDAGDEGFGASVRLTAAPYLNGKNVVHIGLNATWEQPEDNVNNTIQFRSRPESHLTDYLVDTGVITDVSSINRNALEFAFVFASFSLQSEYMHVFLERKNAQVNLEFNGAYVYASWFINGGPRPYRIRDGVFTRIKPENESGAWELALRYSHIDLNSKTIFGGAEDNITLGLNWYINPRVRFTANLISVDTDEHAGNEDPVIFQLRGQIDFEV